MKAALVVLSGGQDSTTCLFWAMNQPSIVQIECITFDYAQRHSREIQAARLVVAEAQKQWEKPIVHTVRTLGPVFEGSSPLTGHDALETYDDIKQMDAVIQNRVELTFVPGRNAVFLALAYSYAVVRGLDTLITGVCQADAANYPDCRQHFVTALEIAMHEATDQHVNIVTPLMDLAKPASIQLAQSLPGCMEALAFRHTSYSGEYPPRTQDHATVLRAWGFEEAGVPDPLIVRAWKEGLMPLPGSANYDVLRNQG